MASDGFNGEDRKNLTNVCRDMVWMKEQSEKRMNEIAERQASGERRLHERIDEAHHRINKIRFISPAVAAISGFFGGIGSYLGFGK